MDYEFVVSEFYTLDDTVSACHSLPAKQRYQANARERYRTHSVNSAFNTLRLLIPTEPKNRKLSKIETLRLAKSYISHLAAILLTGNYNQPCVYVTTPASFHPAYMELQRLDEDDEDEERLMEHSRTSICTFCVATKNSSS
ncbi:basic helix-loop-helix transcription factor scleraxis-like [Phlebotomus argentipes]|uniref:basic helix-loop-helix transcription factor scleraxis-like n=1 Tax=Phlebotomus argentipes TaxID=94469 RepID=UPI00289315EB|nr:basic helix-loop-helix transcription factor scleraxis-like [Phlebotomus argentipes]